MIAVMKGENGAQRWCDDVRTPKVETCEELAGRAFDLAAADLKERYGGIIAWGKVHKAQGIHRPFGVVPILERFFNVEPETPGDAYTVDVGNYTIRDATLPYGNRHAPSLRAIYDLDDLDRSLYMQSTGQSGNVLSPWYSNMADRWAHVEYITIPTRRPAIVAAHTLTLTP